MDLQSTIGQNPIFIIFIVALGIWDITWKGIALWHAAKNSHQKWFIALLIINSLGIIPIIYVYYYSKKSKKA